MSNPVKVMNIFYRADAIEPLNYNYRYQIYEKKWHGESYGNWFKDKEEALKHFQNAQNIALEKFKIINEKLKEFKKEFDFDISYLVLGDTHGIDEEYQYIDTKINGYVFTFKIGD